MFVGRCGHHQVRGSYTDRMGPLYWPHVTRLTLSILNSREFRRLLQRNALPMLEHLNVTIESMDPAFAYCPRREVPPARLTESELRRNADGTRLRTLSIRHIELHDMILLLDSLSMPLLVELTLIDIYANGE